ncbi:MAG: serine/threonine-protein kinase [Planctomycetaceae bacterium]
MAPRTIGPFQLDRQIGIGGMGIVYSAVYLETGKQVAVKVLSPGLISDPKLVKRFEREMEILKRLNHPNIVKYFGGGYEKNQRYYAMEFIDGGSLQDVLKKRTRLSWEQAIHVGRQVSSALEHAHNAGIIHRDLKPANLFLTKKGRLKLGDFGIARDTEATALTAAGKTVGTYAYMAPEQIQAGPAISGRTDLYALGCVLYEVMVGETPFKSDNPMDMLMQHLQDDPYNVCEKVPDCPVWLDELVEQLLAKNPDDRPHDALAVHTRLGEIRDLVASGGPVSMAAPLMGRGTAKKSKAEDQETPVPVAKKKKKKKKKGPFHEQTWFLVTCLLALLGATVWLLLPPGEDWYAEKWREAMSSGDQYAQRSSLEKHVDAYLERFPDGKHVDAAREVSDKLHANILEPQLRNLAKLKTPVEPPFKAECVAAATMEDEEGLYYFISWDNVPEKDLQANPLPAMQRWHRLIQKSAGMDRNDDQTRWLIQVCRNHHDYFRRKLIESPRAEEFLRERMLEAEELMAKGDRSAALEIWQYVISEFDRVQRFKTFYDYASQRNNLADAPVPPAGRADEGGPARGDADG